MKIKICGMRDDENIRAVSELRPDYMGFVFYPRSPRFAAALNAALLQGLDCSIRRVGVFVDAGLELMEATVQKHSLHAIQLHGTETPDLCRAVAKRMAGIEIIKAFAVGPSFRFVDAAPFEECCARFLFDAAARAAGGSGTAFDWTRLDEYQGKTPFFLSGGIGADNIKAAVKAASEHPRGYGIDVNSRVETSPGVKALALVRQVISEVRA
jgi:phosphoribosylanthranilate isomerase